MGTLMRRTMRTFVMLAALLTLRLSLVALSPTPTGEGDWREYYPLAIGNSWTYKVWEEGKEPSTVEWRVTQVMKEASGEVFVIWPSPPIDDESIMLLLTRDGLRESEFGGSPGSFVLKALIKEGDSWSEESHSYTKNRSVSSVARVLSAGKPCRGGEYEFSDCVTVQEDNEDLSLRIITFYSRNVGRVKVEYYRLHSGGSADKPFAVLTLASYKLSSGKPVPRDK